MVSPESQLASVFVAQAGMGQFGDAVSSKDVLAMGVSSTNRL